MDRIEVDHPSRPIAQSVGDLSTIDDNAESVSLPSTTSSFESISIMLPPDSQNGDDEDCSETSKGTVIKNKKSELAIAVPSIAERRRGKKIPALNSRDILRIGMKLETAKITDGPKLFKKPTIIQTEVEDVRNSVVPIPDVEIHEVEVEMEEIERPIPGAPKIRRVSDVIDSLGTSTPNSPRTPASFTENGITKTVTHEWLPKFSTSPPVTKRVADRADSAPMGKLDNYDATPISDEEDDKRHVYARMPVERNSDEYNMGHGRRGRAIVFNHDTFDTGYEARPGSEVDAKALDVTFTALDFQVTVYHNLEYADIKRVIGKLKEEDHSDADCLVIVILSHGIQGGYILSRDVPYSVEYLWHSFKADVCPTLAGKPKMFFIQACRGDKVDKGVHMMRSPMARTQVDSAVSDYKIPSFADFLIAFSTVDGHYAWRNPEDGTWFIQCLCKELAENGSEIDLLRLMTRTARRVALDHESFNDLKPWTSEMKQVPSINSMLIRDVYFRPKGKLSNEIDVGTVKDEKSNVETEMET